MMDPGRGNRSAGSSADAAAVLDAGVRLLAEAMGADGSLARAVWKKAF